MATTDLPRASDHAGGRAGRTAASILAGIIGGAVMYYATAVVGSAPAAGVTTSPLVLLLLAVVAAVGVAGGWRWPVAGVSSAAAIAGIVAFAVAQRISWSSASAWLDPFEAVGYGAVSGYPAMLAAAVLTAALLRLRSTLAR